MALLLLDVVVLFIEIFLLAMFPPCNTIERDAISCCPGEDDRWLAGDDSNHLECHDPGLVPFQSYQATCDEDKYPAVHRAELAMFSITMVILGIFFLELNTTMLALSPNIFFRQVFYLLDYVIVTVSLGLELFFKIWDEDIVQSAVGFLIVVRLWRFVRISHGLVEVVAELSHQKWQRLLAYTEELEILLQQRDIPLPDTESIRELKGTADDLVSSIEKEHRKHYQHHLENLPEGEGEEDSS